MALSRYLDRLRGKPQEYFQNSLFLCFSLCYENTIVCGLGTSVEVPRYICSGTSLTLVRPFSPAVVKSTVRVTHSCVASSVLPELGPLDPVHDVIWLWLDYYLKVRESVRWQHGLKTLQSNSHTASAAYSRLGIPLCSFRSTGKSVFFDPENVLRLR